MGTRLMIPITMRRLWRPSSPIVYLVIWVIAAALQTAERLLLQTSTTDFEKKGRASGHRKRASDRSIDPATYIVENDILKS